VEFRGVYSALDTTRHSTAGPSHAHALDPANMPMSSFMRMRHAAWACLMFAQTSQRCARRCSDRPRGGVRVECHCHVLDLLLQPSNRWHQASPGAAADSHVNGVVAVCA